ncbi:MAG: type II toxin-antitoxin system VapC family toxin [Bifidobacteriaceae bacterium]|jgi:PIN domain nuclease of toxin-antitoxin system|nr:type II toxin-antitoxin system VapC family toxin [Bifidobacteriaceae bacterium]
MRLLLDTNVLLWSLEDHPRLAPFRDAVTDGANVVFFSAMSVAEISLKSSLGKLQVEPGYADALAAAGYRELHLTARHAEAAADLPWHHRDPFDRLLIAQALVEGLTVATADRVFEQYEVRVLGA